MGVRYNLVTLGRSEARRLADAIKPFVAQHATRELAAQAMGVRVWVIQRACLGRAGTTFNRDVLDQLGRMTGLDVRLWGSE